ncbi:MAG: hypothetical protein ABIG45_00385 [Bacillota bacterium]
MADQYSNQTPMYTPHSAQAAPQYTAGSMPADADMLNCSFDDTSSWDAPLIHLSVDQPLSHATHIG